MTSESSEFVAAPLRTSSVPQLLNYTLLEASKDLVDQSEWTSQTNQISMWTEIKTKNIINPEWVHACFVVKIMTNNHWRGWILKLSLESWHELKVSEEGPYQIQWKSFTSSQLRFCANAEPKIGMPYGIVNSLCVQSRQIMREKPIIII